MKTTVNGKLIEYTDSKDLSEKLKELNEAKSKSFLNIFTKLEIESELLEVKGNLKVNDEVINESNETTKVGISNDVNLTEVTNDPSTAEVLINSDETILVASSSTQDSKLVGPEHGVGVVTSSVNQDTKEVTGVITHITKPTANKKR